MKEQERGSPYTVILVAFDLRGKKILSEKLSTEKYYDDSHALIDDDEFRKSKSIRRVDGRIFGPDGILDQKFSNLYDENGALKES